MSVEKSQSCPFNAVVSTDRIKSKIEKGKEVEVRSIKDGKFGFFAVAFAEGETSPVFIGLKNLDFASDCTDERKNELEAEKKAWKAKQDMRIFVGTDPDWIGQRSVAFDWTAICRVEDQGRVQLQTKKKVRLFFPLVTRAGKKIYDEKDGTIPQWIWDSKCKEHSGKVLSSRWGHAVTDFRILKPSVGG